MLKRLTTHPACYGTWAQSWFSLLPYGVEETITVQKEEFLRWMNWTLLSFTSVVSLCIEKILRWASLSNIGRTWISNLNMRMFAALAPPTPTCWILVQKAPDIVARFCCLFWGSISWPAQQESEYAKSTLSSRNSMPQYNRGRILSFFNRAQTTSFVYTLTSSYT